MTTVKFDEGVLDRQIETLNNHKEAWATLPIPQKMAMLVNCRDRLGKAAERWVAVSVKGKQLSADSAWVGEEWSSGPWATIEGINGLLETLKAVHSETMPEFGPVRTRENGQVVAHVFPRNTYDKLLTNGISAEVWFNKNVHAGNLQDQIATFYKDPNPKGKVALVLGAGNINSIAPLDTLYKLYADGEVVILKLNPVNEYMAPILEDVFKPFVDSGFLHVVCGGADVGAFLTEHKGIDTIHITGSAKTHDAIVFGKGDEAEKRKREYRPKNNKPITSELGGVGPVIVVPGPWTSADIRYQAERIVSQKLHNGGFNCIAAQVLILPNIWPQSSELLNAIRQLFRELPPRTPYYPQAEDRMEEAISHAENAEQINGRVLITDLNPHDTQNNCFTNEFFSAVLAQTYIDGNDPADYLRNAIQFANETLDGTLGAQIIIHPQTIKQLGDEFEKLFAQLRYGTIGINLWSGVGFLLPGVAWGAYPGHPLTDIESGRGVVHNAYLFDNTEKNVIYGPFWESPRGIKHGYFGMLPKPPWFVTNKTSAETSRLFTEFALDPSPKKLPALVISALRG